MPTRVHKYAIDYDKMNPTETKELVVTMIKMRYFLLPVYNKVERFTIVESVLC